MRKLILAAASAAVLTAAQWPAHAQDLSQPLPFTLKTKPSTTAGASVNVPPGAAPASPNNGDLWTTLTGLWARVNGTTVPIISGPGSSTNGDIPVFTGANGQNIGDSGQSISSLVSQVQSGCVETYCVDSVNGSDSNPGTAAAPFQTFAPIGYGAGVLSGQSVGLACGSHWRAPLPTASSIASYNQSVLSITNTGNTPAVHNMVAGYGIGPNCSALPILDGSAIIPNASFTNAGGGNPNVYYTPTEYFYGGANGYQIFVWETGAATDSATGTYLAYETSESAVNSTSCSFYIPGLTWGGTIPSSAVIYIHSCDGSNAATNGYVYEVSEQIPLTLFSPYSQVLTIELRKTGSNTGMLNLNNDGGSYFASGLILRDGGKHNALVPSGSTINGSLFIDGYYNVSGISDALLVFHDGHGTGLPLIANNDTFQTEQSIAGNGASGATGIISHTDDGSSMGNVVLNNDWFIAKNGTVLSGFGFANVVQVIANQLYGSQLQSGVASYQNLTLSNSQFVSALSLNSPIYVQTNGITLSIDNSEFCGENLAQGILRLNANNLTLSLTNSELYGRFPNANNPALVVNTGSGSTLYYYADDFGSNTQFFRAIEDLGSGNTFSPTSNNNIYEGSPWPPYWQMNSGSTYSTLTTWQTSVSPADSNSVEAGGAAFGACKLSKSMPEFQ